MRFLTLVDFNPGKHAAAFAKVRAAIERDDFAQPNVKKLADGGFYRAKLSAADRLLLRFVRHANETVCLALEVIENHAYERSRFLRGSSAPLFVSEDADTVQAIEAPTESLAYVHPERADYHYLDKPLSFDDAQDAIYRLAPPMLLVGAAGSGKTALALAKMRGAVGAIAYVTQSPFLAQRSRAVYFAEGFDDERQEVDFLSFRELLESIRVPPGRAVTFKDFRAWFERHKKDLKHADAHQCFEEIRGVLTSQPEGPLTLDAYVELGVRRSIFPPPEREALYRLWEKYRAFLAERGLFDTNLVAHGHLAIVEPRYDFVVVDEVQDLTNVELTLVLRTLKERGAFVLSGDSNQIVHPNFFAWSTLKSLFWRDAALAGNERVAVLDVNYRNARRVTEVANALLKVKHARFGSVDKESNGLVRAVTEQEGEVVGLPAKDSVLSDLDAKTRRSTDVAVLVLRDEHKEAAKKRFGTPLVFAVHEAKGLEYESVVLFEFVSSERRVFGEIAEGVTAADLEVEELAFRRARDKTDKSLEVYKFFVNALYVALTRAVRRVYVVETDAGHPMLRLLGVTFEADAARVQGKTSSVEAWQLEAHKLELQGKEEQARAIRENILKVTPVPWTVLDRAGYRALADKALAPRSIFNKAKQQLFQYACFQGDRALAERLARDAGYAPAADYDAQRSAQRARVLAPYAQSSFKDVLAETERHGVDHRTVMNATPLMLAAAALNTELVRALVARGASLDAMDSFGRTAMHYALLFAAQRADAKARELAPVWELVAPPSVDVLVDGRLVKVGRQQGEYLLFALMLVLQKELHLSRLVVLPGLRASVLEERMAGFPEAVVAEHRKRRPYINALLARLERDSAAPNDRKLWQRTRHGYYVLNPGLQLRVRDGEGERWAPLREVLGTELLEEHRLKRAAVSS